MKKFFTLTFKIIMLSAVYAILYIIGGALLGPQVPRTPATQAGALMALPLVSLVDTLVLTLVILCSNWSGWRLMLAAAVSYYGVQTFMAAVEVAYFGPAMGISAALLPGFFLQSIFIPLLFVPLAVIALGKHHQSDTNPSVSQRLVMPPIQWVWKLAVIAVIYLLLYNLFGYFVAWQNPNLTAMYGNGANKEVFDFAKLIPLQLGRGVLWTLFAMPVIRMSKGNAWQIALLVGLLLALPMNMGHVMPNPFMPDPSVRLSHFIETSTSNFIFGVFLTQLILWRPAPKHSLQNKIVQPG